MNLEKDTTMALLRPF